MKKHIVYGAVIVAVAAWSAAPLRAQDKHEFSDQFLTNQQGELCTMCEADVVCTPEATAPPRAENVVAPLSTGAVNLHFHKRGFVGQMLTVLDYFPFTRRFGLSHSRDVDIAQEGAAATTGEATFNLETKRIDIAGKAGAPMFWIDRATSTWHSPDGAVRGTCTRK